MHTVLVVDDDAAVRRAIKHFLTFDGFATVEASNGQAALAYLRGGGTASVILLDLHMPVMDGWTFRREQLGDPVLAGIPVIVLSDEQVHRAQEIAAVVAFAKPARLSTLIQCVRRICEPPQPLSAVTAHAVV